MSDVVIRAEGLGKKYLIGHQINEPYVALRDVMARTAKGFARSARDILRGRQLIDGDEVEEFWALKDVNFEIRRGDVVGIIGRNGAGKSTLLKILSRITEPTTGRVEIRGRVASLLEVGTGFHPELTGRENIYLNGAILGMSRGEIKHKFEEIVAFAEVEKFLDTPVKRYSSGMYVRLAFAVAAHLEPEILVIDEVLAVGDVDFQKKCLGKMSEVAGHGRTVLFVSHNLTAISILCRSGFYLSDGKGEYFHSIHTALDRYLRQYLFAASWSGTQYVDAAGFQPTELTVGENLVIGLRGKYDQSIRNFVIALRVMRANGEEVFCTTHLDASQNTSDIHGDVRFFIAMPQYLTPGDYFAELVTFIHNREFIIAPEEGPRISFSVPNVSVGSDFFRLDRSGAIRPLIAWERHNENEGCAQDRPDASD